MADESEKSNGNCEQRPKPLLTVDQQIAHLKARGVTFELCSEDHAADFLRYGDNLLRASSYRKLFPVQNQGPQAGKYLGPDFMHLKTLARDAANAVGAAGRAEDIVGGRPKPFREEQHHNFILRFSLQTG